MMTKFALIIELGHPSSVLKHPLLAIDDTMRSRTRCWNILLQIETLKLKLKLRLIKVEEMRNEGQ